MVRARVVGTRGGVRELRQREIELELGAGELGTVEIYRKFYSIRYTRRNTNGRRRRGTSSESAVSSSFARDARSSVLRLRSWAALVVKNGSEKVLIL